MTVRTAKSAQTKAPLLVFSIAACLCCMRAASPVYAADLTQKIQPVIITAEASIKKSGTFAHAFDVFIVPVLAIGSGKCKATLALAEPKDAEVMSLFCYGICFGPYTVFDCNTATSQYSVSTTVSVESWGGFFLLATSAGPAENFPQKLSVTVQF